jgi:hypothetical protein
LGKTSNCLVDLFFKRSPDCPYAGFALDIALEFSRETANILLHFLNHLLEHATQKIFRKVLRKFYLVFLIVPTEGKFCVCSLSEDPATLINQLSIVRFLSEVEGEAVILAT